MDNFEKILGIGWRSEVKKLARVNHYRLLLFCYCCYFGLLFGAVVGDVECLGFLDF